MTKQLPFFSILSIIGMFLLVAPVFAQTPATTTIETQDVTASTSNEIPTPSEIAVEQVSTGTELSPETQVRITNLAANISNRADALIARLDSITIRMESRAYKLSVEGYDVRVAELSINDAKSALANARYSIARIDSVVAQSVTSKNPQEAWKDVRALFFTTKTEILSAKQHLRDALSTLKNPQTPITIDIQETETATTTE